MDIESLRNEFDEFLKKSGHNCSDPDVVRKGLETEKAMFELLKQAEA